MEYISKLNYKISKISLGTVQFGLDYGISNNYGKPSEKKVENILSKAFEKGINILDTAREYGESEEIIGRILAKYSHKSDILICTKLGKFKKSQLDSYNLQKEIDGMVETSLNNLNLENIPIYLLHEASHMNSYDGFIIETLKKQQEKGNVGHLGVSIYTPEEAETALSIDEMEVIQVPFNILDQRLVKSKFFQRANNKGKLILVRSVFLQGLLFMIARKQIPQRFMKFNQYFDKLDKIIKSHNYTIGQLALRYAIQKSNGSFILGVDSCEQLIENLGFFSNNKIPQEIIIEIEKEFFYVPQELIDPRMWDEL